MTDTGVASDKPLENEIQHRLKKFQNLNKLKRQALKLIASYMPPDEVQGLRNQFKALDRDSNGMHNHADNWYKGTAYASLQSSFMLALPFYAGNTHTLTRLYQTVPA